MFHIHNVSLQPHSKTCTLKGKLHTYKAKAEKAILVGIKRGNSNSDDVDEHLKELEFLALTAGAQTDKIFVQSRLKPDPKTFIGTGKMEEVILYVKEHKIDMVIFDDALTPSQIRNIENQLKEVKILDRNNLILDIFASNAKTARAKIQVELAQCQYLLPRLTRMWTHLSKQKGGIGMKGPGETEIETDRRNLRNKIIKLKERLGKIEKQDETRRKNRSSQARVALVGYTNVGKSTIMNLLGKADVMAENKLFATLDSTVRKVALESPYAPGHYKTILLSDTVGFIRKLPHELIESFKSTLAESVEADILLHVVDYSHSHFEDQLNIVNTTLHEIGVDDKPIILVFNKIDNLNEEEKESLNGFKNHWLAKQDQTSIFISAKESLNIQDLKNVIWEETEKLRYN
jgi:GTP-binding protein HflX